MAHIFVANTLLNVFIFFRSFPWPEDFLFLSRFCQKMFLVSRFCQQIFAVSRFCFRKQISSEDFLRQQICFSSANVFTLLNKTTLAPAHLFSRQHVSWGKHFLLRRARIFAAITIALVLPDLPAAERHVQRQLHAEAAGYASLFNYHAKGLCGVHFAHHNTYQTSSFRRGPGIVVSCWVYDYYY